ncbi:MAG: response regulator [Planctomycetota bacterium]|jgi:CheY-like chemotaxis protein
MNVKILVVDDQKDLLELLSMALGQEGYSVRTAASGAEALSMIAAEKPDLILLDIILGDISGIKITTKLKHEAETSHIPIILLTAKDSESGLALARMITLPSRSAPRFFWREWMQCFAGRIRNHPRSKKSYKQARYVCSHPGDRFLPKAARLI